MIINNNPNDFSIPSSEGMEPVGNVRSFQWVIKRWQNGIDKARFWLTYDGRDVAYVELNVIEQYYALKTAFAIPEFQNKGLVSELVHWIIKDQSGSVINNTVMSQHDLELWRSLMTRMDANIINIMTGEEFPLDHCDKPEDDTGEDQEMFYMIKPPEYFYHVRDGVRHHYGCNIARHKYRHTALLPAYFRDGEV